MLLKTTCFGRSCSPALRTDHFNLSPPGRACWGPSAPRAPTGSTQGEEHTPGPLKFCGMLGMGTGTRKDLPASLNFTKLAPWPQAVSLITPFSSVKWRYSSLPRRLGTRISDNVCQVSTTQKMFNRWELLLLFNLVGHRKQTWIWTPVLPLTICQILGRLLSLSESHFLYL